MVGTEDQRGDETRWMTAKAAAAAIAMATSITRRDLMLVDSKTI